MGAERKNLSLGDLGRVVTGKTPLTTVEGNFGGLIPFVTPSDMDGRKTISKTARYLTDSGAESVKSSLIKAGSIMVSCIGSDMGKAVIAGRDCVTNQQINSIVVDERFCSEFVYYNLSTRKNELRRQAAGGSAQPILNKTDFTKLSISLPPLAEQKAIANILGTLDEKIELNRRMNATLEAMTRALFKSWFVDFDPVRAKAAGRNPAGLDPSTSGLFPASFHDTQLGELPTGWQIISLDELTSPQSPITYGVVQPGNADPAGVKFIRSGDIFNGRIAEQQLRTISQTVSEQYQRTVLSGGEVLISLVGNPGQVAIVPERLRGANIARQVGLIRPRSGIGPFFIKLYLSSSRGKKTLGAQELGSVQQVINLKDLRTIKLIWPGTEIENRFTQIINPFAQKIDANEDENSILRNLRDGLLPKLLSGQLQIGSL